MSVPVPMTFSPDIHFVWEENRSKKKFLLKLSKQSKIKIFFFSNYKNKTKTIFFLKIIKTKQSEYNFSSVDCFNCCSQLLELNVNK